MALKLLEILLRHVAACVSTSRIYVKRENVGFLVEGSQVVPTDTFHDLGETLG